MLPHRVGSAGHVALLERPQDAAVFGVCTVVTEGKGQTLVPLRVLPQDVDQVRQPRRRSDLVQTEVELAMETQQGVLVARLVGRLHLFEHGAETSGLVTGQPASRAQRRGLDEDPGRVEVPHVVHGEAGDSRPFVGNGRDQPLGFERAQRLADGDQAHADLTGQLLEPEPGARFVLAPQDPVSGDGDHPVDQARAGSPRPRHRKRFQSAS